MPGSGLARRGRAAPRPAPTSPRPARTSVDTVSAIGHADRSVSSSASATAVSATVTDSSHSPRRKSAWA